jgi:hypothetical protein
VRTPAGRCVWLTGAAVPFGGLLGAFLASQIAGSRGQGFADIAWFLTGLMFAGPVAALAVFLVTLPSVRVARPRRAVLVMSCGALVVALISVLMLAMGSRAQADGTIFVLLFLVNAAVAAGFARLALVMAARSV